MGTSESVEAVSEIFALISSEPLESLMNSQEHVNYTSKLEEKRILKLIHEI